MHNINFNTVKNNYRILVRHALIAIVSIHNGKKGDCLSLNFRYFPFSWLIINVRGYDYQAGSVVA
jgi:hypothetical protein